MDLSALLRKKPEAKAQDVDVREAFTLWDVLNSKYLALEKILLYKPFIHDTDFKLLLFELENEVQKNIEILQKQLKKYNILSPNKNRVAAQKNMNSVFLADESIAEDILLYEQEHIENMLISLYSLMTNDSVRKVFIRMLFRTLDLADQIMKYTALKGWSGLPPAYQHLPAENYEDIHCGEVGCLWDMLVYRYDTLHFTEIMRSIVHDADLKLILEAGIAELRQQIELLEKELIHFGIPLPRRPADVTVSINNKDLWEDSHIYRMILMGMQGAGTLHVRSFKKISTNHRLRALQKKLLRQEVEKIDDFVRYGKLKGWLHSVPIYGP